MGDRCYIELTCKAKDEGAFEDIGYVRDECLNDLSPGLISMVDEEGYTTELQSLDDGILFYGTSGCRQGAYGAYAFACDGKKFDEVETSDDNGAYVVEFDEVTGKALAKSVANVRRFIRFRNRVQVKLAESAQ